MDILITETITNATVNRVLKEILDHKRDPEITVYVNSQGGEVEAGYAIYEILKLSQKRIITYAVNEVFSCAIIIFLAGDDRCASNYSNFMIHEPYHAHEEESSIDSKSYKKYLKELRKTTDDYFKLITKHTTLTPQRIKKYIQQSEEGEWYFKTALAKKLGLVTRIGVPF